MTGRLTGAVAAVAGLTAFVLAGSGPRPTLLGLVGVLALFAGLLGVRGDAVTLGAACLFCATLLAGVNSGGTGTVVAASGALVVAWTVGRTSVELRTDLPDADVRRLSATHVAGTTVLVGAAGAVALLPRYLTVRPSALGLALTLFGAVTLTTAVLIE